MYNSMKALSIVFIILAILAILCICPIVISVSYINEELDYSIRYIGIRIFPPKEKKQKIRHNKKNKRKREKPEKHRDNTEEPKKNSNETSTTEDVKEEKATKNISKLESLGKKLNQILDMIKSSKKGTKTIFKHISITDIFIDFEVADEDAYKCAMDYARANIILYNIIGLLGSYIKLAKKSISTKVSFGEAKGKYDISFKIKLGLGIGIVVFVGIIIRFLRNTIKREKLKEA